MATALHAASAKAKSKVRLQASPWGGWGGWFPPRKAQKKLTSFGIFFLVGWLVGGGENFFGILELFWVDCRGIGGFFSFFVVDLVVDFV